MKKKDIRHTTLSTRGMPLAKFILRGDLLHKQKCMRPEPRQMLEKIIISITSLKQFSRQWKIRVRQTNDAFQADHFSWTDGQGFFDTWTTHLRVIQNKTNPIHVAIAKWVEHHNWVNDLAHLWNETWQSTRL